MSSPPVRLGPSPAHAGILKKSSPAPADSLSPRSPGKSSSFKQRQPLTTNKNVEWVGHPGAWALYVGAVLLTWLVRHDTLPALAGSLRTCTTYAMQSPVL